MRFTLLMLALLSCATHAEESDGPTPCDNVETDQQSYDCSAYNRKTSEAEMNGSYTDLLDRINSQFPKASPELKSFNDKLKAAQDLWSKSRDADCEVYTVNAGKGTKAYEIAQNDCRAQKSDERSEFLQSVGLE
jgi:uncharacterized protein YecT (DUF1311 family)